VSNNITKIDISKNLSQKTGFSILFCRKLLDDLIDLINKNIKDGKFNLKNIGTFKLVNKKKRIGRNPKTNEEFIITARKSISFKSSNKILKMINIDK
jgi:integration host factor subunit alpha